MPDIIVLGDTESEDYIPLAVSEDEDAETNNDSNVYNQQTQQYSYDQLTNQTSPNEQVGLTSDDQVFVVHQFPASSSSNLRRTRSTALAHRVQRQSSPRPVKRSRDGKSKKEPPIALPKTPKNEDKHNESQNEIDTGCIICLEPFENYGKHKPASLKCGHIFGESCLYTWLERAEVPKCPHCNSVARKKEVRTLYCSKVVGIDVAERDKALEQLEREKSLRVRIEIENGQLKMKNRILASENEALRKKLEQEQYKLQHSDLSQTQVQNRFYRIYSHLPLCSKGGSRRIVFDPVQKVFVASQMLDFLTTNQGHGLRKISAHDFKTSKIIKTHDDSIKAMVGFDSKILSGGSDKKLCLTCLKSDVVIQTWTVPLNNSIWACEFNRSNSNLMYVAGHTGTIFTYDSRELSKPVNVLPPSDNMKALPVTSLNFVPFDSPCMFNSSGLLVGGLDGCRFLKFNQSGESCSDGVVYPLNSHLRGNCVSLCYEAESNHIVATFRPGANVKNVRHVVAQLSSDRSSTTSDQYCGLGYSANKIHEFYGGVSMKQMSRSCIYKAPTGKDSQLFVSAYDQSSEQLMFWESNNGIKVQSVKLKDFTCLDLCPVELNNQHFLATLSDSSIKFLKYC